jgi:FixJ family two-component response regulator
MVFAAVSSQTSFQAIKPACFGSRPERRGLHSAAEAYGAGEPSPVIHLIHADEMAAEGIAHCWEWLGARTQIYPDAAAFMIAGPGDSPGCVVVHVQFVHTDGLDAEDTDAMPHSPLPIIVTTERANVRIAVLAMKAGAVDFFETPLCDRDLCDAVENAISSDRARREIEARQGSVLARFATLTPRERQVMSLVTRGLLNKQVAGDLGLSEITVKVHRGSAMRKMSARTIADLVRMADLLASCIDRGSDALRNSHSALAGNGAAADLHKG